MRCFDVATQLPGLFFAQDLRVVTHLTRPAPPTRGVCLIFRFVAIGAGLCIHVPGQARRGRPDRRRLCRRARMTPDHGPSGNGAWPNSCPSKTMAQGKPGCPTHPQPPVQRDKHTSGHRRFTGSIRLSLHHGFSGLFRAPLVTGLFCHRRLRTSDGSSPVANSSGVLAFGQNNKTFLAGINEPRRSHGPSPLRRKTSHAASLYGNAMAFPQSGFDL
jgi:hypothetical protein